jgi:transcriptional regulator with XRE-family HTH domain
LDDQLQDKGWKDAELARRGNFSATTLTNVRAGVRRPGFKLINGIAIALNVTSEEVAAKAGRLGDADDTTLESNDEETKLLKKIRRLFGRMDPGTQETYVGETMAARDEKTREKKPARDRAAKART